MRVDLTINIPTIISILGCVAAITATGFNLYNDLNNRQKVSEATLIQLSARVDKIEGNQSTQISALRTEMKGDIIEIKDLLNRIIFDRPVMEPRRRQLDKDWSK